MQNITQMLLNNAGQRLTQELINGMNHAIKIEFDKLQAQIDELRSEQKESE